MMNYFNSPFTIRRSLFTIGVLCVFIFSSCKKEESSSQQDAFIKSYQSDFDISVVASFPLDDGDYLTTGNDQFYVQLPVAYKFDTQGNMVWKKSLSPLVKTLWSATAAPGTGFVAVGINDYNSGTIYMCRYNYEGNFVSADSIVTPLTNDLKTPCNIIHLSNGNFAVAGGGSASGHTRVIILNPSLQVLYSNLIETPADNYFIYCKAICEMPGGAIAIASTVSDISMQVKKLFILKINLQGDSLASNFIDDITHSETPNAIVPFNGGLLAVAARMTGDLYGGDNNHGIVTNYYSIFSDYGRLVSGVINLDRFTSDCQLSSRTEIKGYPNNGQMSSIRQSTDGGYILCGTVNQLNNFIYPSDIKIYLLKLDANLQIQWSKIVVTTYPSLGIDAMPTNDGGYLVTGFHKALNKRFEPLVIKTNANGNY